MICRDCENEVATFTDKETGIVYHETGPHEEPEICFFENEVRLLVKHKDGNWVEV